MLQVVEQAVNVNHEQIVAEINTDIGNRTAKRTGRLEVTGSYDVTTRFKAECGADGKIPSRVCQPQSTTGSGKTTLLEHIAIEANKKSAFHPPFMR